MIDMLPEWISLVRSHSTLAPIALRHKAHVTGSPSRIIHAPVGEHVQF